MKYLVLSAALVFLATPRLWAGSTTLFQRDQQGGVLVQVTINGHGPFLMLLDTGASHSTVTDAVVAATAARVVARSQVITPTDAAIRPVVVLETLTLGPHTVDALLASVVADGTFDPAGRIQGLIGQDVLAGLRFTLDYRRDRLEWHEEPPPRHGTTLRLAFDSGRFLVDLPQQGGTLRLVPDSGAACFVLFAVEGRVGVSIADTGRTVELSSVGARRTVRQVLLKEMRLGDRTLRDLPAVTLERHEARAADGDGLLPLHLFARVTFDGPARLLSLEP